MKANDRQEGGNHYKTMKVQPWDAMECWMTHDEFVGFLKGCAIKYLARTKNDKLEDAKKAIHFLQKMVEVMELYNESTRKRLEDLEVVMPYNEYGSAFGLAEPPAPSHHLGKESTGAASVDDVEEEPAGCDVYSNEKVRADTPITTHLRKQCEKTKAYLLHANPDIKEEDLEIKVYGVPV